MPTPLPDVFTTLQPTSPRVAELDRLGDEIAELSAHLEAATARLLALIREFDARGGWNTGFRSCAAWLAWRVGLEPGAARERVRVARALGTLPALAEALARGVHAFMPTALDHVYCRIYRLHHAGRRDAARALFERLLPVLAFTQAHINVSIRFLKHLRQRQGIFATDRCRVPPALDAFQQAEMATLVARALALDAEAAQETREDARC